MSGGIKIRESRCRGCANCIKSCPTEALRVIDGLVRILPDLCIDCGECIRAVKNKAITVNDDEWDLIKSREGLILMADPTFYVQVGAYSRPRLMKEALEHHGLRDLSEWASLAFDLAAFASARLIRDAGDNLPYISTYCPAVLRLIQISFRSSSGVLFCPWNPAGDCGFPFGERRRGRRESVTLVSPVRRKRRSCAIRSGGSRFPRVRGERTEGDTGPPGLQREGDGHEDESDQQEMASLVDLRRGVASSPLSSTRVYVVPSQDCGTRRTSSTNLSSAALRASASSSAARATSDVSAARGRTSPVFSPSSALTTSKPNGCPRGRRWSRSGRGTTRASGVLPRRGDSKGTPAALQGYQGGDGEAARDGRHLRGASHRLRSVRPPVVQGACGGYRPGQ